MIHLPEILFITGQSGSGKGVVKQQLAELCDEHGISLFMSSTGDLFRKCIAKETFLAKRIGAIINQGKFGPEFIADALVMANMIDLLKENQTAVLEGGPRTLKECASIHEWSASGFFTGGMKVLEVIAPDTVCKERLAGRTKLDHRADLSVEGQPGVPDFEKIETKMSQYSSQREAIVRNLIVTEMYLSVQNNGSIPQTKESLRALFKT